MLKFVDIEMDDDGDLVVGSNGDLKVADTRRTVVQDVINRVRTQYDDLVPHPTFGSNVPVMHGEVNNSLNGSLIQSMITRALTYDGRFMPSDFMIDVIPTAEDTITVLVIFEALFEDVNTQDALVVSFSFNYDTGTIEPIAGPGQSGSGATP